MLKRTNPGACWERYLGAAANVGVPLGPQAHHLWTGSWSEPVVGRRLHVTMVTYSTYAVHLDDDAGFPVGVAEAGVAQAGAELQRAALELAGLLERLVLLCELAQQTQLVALLDAVVVAWTQAHINASARPGRRPANPRPLLTLQQLVQLLRVAAVGRRVAAVEADFGRVRTKNQTW